MELHLNMGWSIGEKENHLSRKEKCCGLVSAALLPTAGLNVNTPDRGVCMSWVLGLGPKPGHVSWLTSLNWLPPAAAVTRLVAGAASPDQWPHSPHCSSWLVPPTLTFSSCSRSRSCHDQPNLTRSPSCFKNATFMRSDWRTGAKWVAASCLITHVTAPSLERVLAPPSHQLTMLPRSIKLLAELSGARNIISKCVLCLQPRDSSLEPFP